MGTSGRNLFAVTAASFIGTMGFTLVMPFLPLYLHQLGVTSDGEVAMWAGLSLGVTPALTALLAPAWGRLADRYGRKIMVERSLASFVVIMAATAYATRAWHVFALRAIQGLFAGYGSLTLTMGADSAPEGRMAQSIGLVQTAQRLGPALGPVFGGTIAAFVGLRHAFFVTAAFYVIATLLVFVMYDERIVQAKAQQAVDRNGGVTFRDVFAFENFLLMSVVIFGFQFVDRSIGPVLPLYVGQLGTPAGNVALMSGILFSVAAAAGALGHHFCARLLRRRTPVGLIVVASAVGAIGAGFYVGATSSFWLFIGTPIFGIAIGLGMTAAYTAAADVIPVTARGVGFGLLTTASLVGMAASPVVAGFLGATSIRAVFGLDVVALAALVAIVRATGIQKRHDKGAATEAAADPTITESV